MTFAIDAAPAATPPNPNMAATIAMIRNITVQRSIIFYLKYNIPIASRKVMPALKEDEELPFEILA
jgi:hypothetical protein